MKNIIFRKIWHQNVILHKSPKSVHFETDSKIKKNQKTSHDTHVHLRKKQVKNVQIIYSL